jgi:hypothetical protein
VLLVESGSRYLLEDLIPGIYETHPELENLDIVTCFPGQPSTFDPARGRIWRIGEYRGRENRKRLYRELTEAGHTVTGVICSGEAIMTKWKTVLAWKTSGKVFILNENGDYFWLDRENRSTVRHFMLYRTGLAGAGAVRTLAQLVLFPFTLIYLLLFAAFVNLRRAIRS